MNEAYTEELGERLERGETLSAREIHDLFCDGGMCEVYAPKCPDDCALWMAVDRLAAAERVQGLRGCLTRVKACTRDYERLKLELARQASAFIEREIEYMINGPQIMLPGGE